MFLYYQWAMVSSFWGAASGIWDQTVAPADQWTAQQELTSSCMHMFMNHFQEGVRSRLQLKWGFQVKLKLYKVYAAPVAILLRGKSKPCPCIVSLACVYPGTYTCTMCTMCIYRLGHWLNSNEFPRCLCKTEKKIWVSTRSTPMSTALVHSFPDIQCTDIILL